MMEDNIVSIEESMLELVSGGSLGSFLGVTGIISTYITLVTWAEHFGEGLGNGLYDGLHQ